MEMSGRKFIKVTCLSCGWAAYQITRADAETCVASFNLFYDSAPEEVQQHYGGRSDIDDYERCTRCGGDYKNFRDFKEGDCPDGCTLSPIIDRTDQGV